MEDTDIKEFIKRAKDSLAKFEESLDWSLDDCVQTNTNIQCPLSCNHQIPESSLQKHLRKCKWRRHGYTPTEVKEILEKEDSQYRTSNQLVELDDAVAEVAPDCPPLRTHELYTCLLSREERLLIYDHIIQKFPSGSSKIDPSLLVDLQKQALEKLRSSQDAEKDMSTVELRKQQRDHKRRRQTYRAKNVHITKRSQTEIIRDVLRVHMEELRQLWNPDIKLESQVKREPEKREEQTPAECPDIRRQAVERRHSESRRREFSTREKTSPFRFSAGSSKERRSPDRKRSTRDRSPRFRDNKKHHRRKRSRSRDEKGGSRKKKHSKHKHKKKSKDGER